MFNNNQSPSSAPNPFTSPPSLSGPPSNGFSSAPPSGPPSFATAHFSNGPSSATAHSSNGPSSATASSSAGPWAGVDQSEEFVSVFSALTLGETSDKGDKKIIGGGKMGDVLYVKSVMLNKPPSEIPKDFLRLLKYQMRNVVGVAEYYLHRGQRAETSCPAEGEYLLEIQISMLAQKMNNSGYHPPKHIDPRTQAKLTHIINTVLPFISEHVKLPSKICTSQHDFVVGDGRNFCSSCGEDLRK